MKEKEFTVNTHLKIIRKDFEQHTLLEENCSENPFDQFQKWLTEAMETDSHFANAMTLSTVSSGGMPDARIVLLRNLSYGGFTFFTNYKSNKGQEIAFSSQACLTFFWKESQRQVKIQGEIRFLPAVVSDEYFKSRPFENQIGAWTSKQSTVVKDRKSLDEAYDKELAKYEGNDVPRPEHWGGYVLVPIVFEFWQGRKSRLHDRVRYKLRNKEHDWQMERLMP